MASELLYFNGVNASRGEYAREPISVEQFAQLIGGAQPGAARVDPDPEQLQELKRRDEQRQAGSFGFKEGIDGRNLAQTGWGIIFPAAVDYSPVREALSELLAWRKQQAGARYRECFGQAGYAPGERKADFLRRQGAATSGPVDPDLFPYYLLIVGSPEEISFRFQYQLDVQYAVGRLHFATVAEYANYARGVVATEQGAVKIARRAVFFGVQNPDDVATARSTNELVLPLAARLPKDQRASSWHIETITGAQATKARLLRLLGGDDTPALTFTASHGAEFEQIDNRQIPHQGAILCADWPGPRQWRAAIPPKHYLAGEDIPSDARVAGTIAFHFACFGAGTPRLDDFPHERGFQASIAPHAFIARLPQRLLGHPNGGALAVIGHVERAWTYSFSDARGGQQLETFNSMLRRLLLEGLPVGFALEFFNERYAELATILTEDMETLRYKGVVDPYELTARWTEHNDARSYVVLGDPAARLALVEPGASDGELRPVLAGTAPEIRSHEAGAGGSPTRSPAGAAGQEAPPMQSQTQPQTPQTPAEPQTPPAAAPAQPPGQPGYPPPGYPPPGQPGYPPPGAYGYPPAGHPAPIIIYAGYAPPPQGQPGYPPQGQGPGSSFGVGDWFRGGEAEGGGSGMGEFAQKLTDTLKEFTDRLGETFKQVLEDAAHLQVETYVAEDLTVVAYQQGDFSAARLRAVTRMKLDGDTKVLVPLSAGELDEQLWEVHTAMVAQAQANRAEMIRAIASAAAGLLSSLKGK